jgi:hypothetical protein
METKKIAKNNLNFLQTIIGTKLKKLDQYEKLQHLSKHQKVPYVAVLVADNRPDLIRKMLQNKNLIKGIEYSSYPMAVRDILIASMDIEDAHLVFNDCDTYGCYHPDLQAYILEQIRQNTK